MSSTALFYFAVSKSSPINKVIDRCKKQITAHRKGVRKFLKECGFDKKQYAFGHTDWRIFGITGRTDKPGWRWDQRAGCSVPAKLTPEGKEIAERMKAIPLGVDWRAVSEEVFKHRHVAVMDHGRSLCCWASFGWNEKGVLVVMRGAVKKTAKVWPKGLKEVTASEAETYCGDA